MTPYKKKKHKRKTQKTASFFFLLFLCLSPLYADAASISLFQEKTTLNAGRYSPDASSVEFRFTLENLSDKTAENISVKPSCGCTVTSLSSDTIPPKGEAEVTVSVNTIGKKDVFFKKIDFFYLADNMPYMTRAVIRFTLAPPLPGHEKKNGTLLQKTIFGKECGSCHADKGKNKKGAPLFVAVCSQCHGMMAEGKTACPLGDLSYRKEYSLHEIAGIIAKGKTEKGMPAFSEKEGGPLSNEQILSLAQYLIRLGENWKH